MAEREITLKIEGMTCASCVAKIDGALREVSGVVEALEKNGRKESRKKSRKIKVE